MYLIHTVSMVTTHMMNDLRENYGSERPRDTSYSYREYQRCTRESVGTRITLSFFLV